MAVGGAGGIGSRVTAYPASEKELARQLREAAVAHEGFGRRMKVCELGNCRASCCHDGVILTEEERAVIDGVIRGNRQQLDQYGWHEKQWILGDSGRARSVTIESSEPGETFPAHFPRTRCVFLDAGHRCVLQRLAMDGKRHPWFWKPISCWMHPLVLKPGARGGRPTLMLPGPADDPAARPGYPGFASCTPCGMEEEGGEPAWRVLRPELEMLGKIGGRDFVAEISAYGE